MFRIIKKFTLFFWLAFCKFKSSIFKKTNKDLRKLKNMYLGKRVFIVATGPSLTLDDLEMIKDEYSISMNSIIDCFCKTSFRPTFYMIQDKKVIHKIAKKINQSDLKNIIVGIGNASKTSLNTSKSDAKVLLKDKTFFNLDLAYHLYDMYYNTSKTHINYSEDFSKKAFDGYTIAYSAIQFATYLGFTKIYLLGCDCSYGGHFNDNTINENDNKPQPKYFEAYQCAKEYSEKHGISIINCTRGGMLEVFERKDLNQVLGK